MYAEDLVRVSVRWGPASGSEWGTEEAVTTWHLRLNIPTGETTHWPEYIDNLPGQLKAKFDAHWSDLEGHLVTQAQINQIKCAHLDTAGHTIRENAVDVLDGSLTGTNTSGMLPPEVAVVLSEWSYNPGGFATLKGRKRGRFYLPYIPKAVCDASGKMREDYIEPWVTDWQSFFNDVQGMHTDPEATFPVVSYWDFVTASKVDAEWANVDWISIDNHFDSQRRRQHQDTPARFKLPITHS